MKHRSSKATPANIQTGLSLEKQEHSETGPNADFAKFIWNAYYSNSNNCAVMSTQEFFLMAAILKMVATIHSQIQS